VTGAVGAGASRTTAVGGGLVGPAPAAWALARGLHPTPAVAGTPFAAALRTIARLATASRGRYAGHVGWVDGRGDGEWALALRGALVVMLLYLFAKRITGSTVFSTIAALLLTFDGMHFVQSRTATPEGFVIFFATLAVYAFYRFWISSQVGDRRHV